MHCLQISNFIIQCYMIINLFYENIKTQKIKFMRMWAWRPNSMASFVLPIEHNLHIRFITHTYDLRNINTSLHTTASHAHIRINFHINFSYRIRCRSLILRIWYSFHVVYIRRDSYFVTTDYRAFISNKYCHDLTALDAILG